VCKQFKKLGLDVNVGEREEDEDPDDRFCEVSE
jgi:hypothetical protein